jgi:enterochelin esterase family protein
MSKLLAFSLLIFITVSFVFSQPANVNIDWNPQKNVQNLLPCGTKVLSPEVFDDHTVIFRLFALRANEILLTSTVLVGLNTNRPLMFTKRNDSIWTF